MHLRFLVLNTLIFIGCGSTSPKEGSAVPFIEIAPGSKLVADPPQTNDDENDKPSASAKALEAADACRAKMRDGRGLPPDVMASDAGQRYTEALTHERAERLVEARKGYVSVIQQYPQSPIVPLIYFAFGESFFQEAQSEPMKIGFAEQSYREVMKYPPPGNTAMAFSLYRSSQLYASSGKGMEALNTLNKFMTLAEVYPDAECAKSLGDSAKSLMVNTYAEIGQPKRAFEFFARSSGTRGTNKAKAFDMVASLCELYIAKQKPENAAEALVAVNEAHAPRDFCTREQQMMARMSGSIPMTMAEEILRNHVAICQ
jgi:TolA-binding protein